MEKASENSKKFLWVGNDPSIDFINTDIVLEGKPVDLLQSPEDYLAWLGAAGIDMRQTSRAPGAMHQGFQQAKEFRGKLREAYEQLVKTATVPHSILTAVNAYISKSRRPAELRTRGSSFELYPYWLAEKAADYVAPLAWAFAGFLATADLDRIRKCQNPECVLFFYDTSKSGSRRWCSLDICGNKMRMAASRERHQRRHH